MTKETAGAKKAESDGKSFCYKLSAADQRRWMERFLEGRSQISLINNTIPLCNGTTDTWFTNNELMKMELCWSKQSYSIKQRIFNVRFIYHFTLQKISFSFHTEEKYIGAIKSAV